MGILTTLHVDEFATAETWQIKVLALIAVMAYAFFKFAWTFRLQNYCAVLLGATAGGGGEGANGGDGGDDGDGGEDSALAREVKRMDLDN